MLPQKIIKRNGQIVDFDETRIENAIKKAMLATGVYSKKNLEKVLKEVLRIIEEVFDGTRTPSVEEIQDIVEVCLMKTGFFETAKAYVLYREKKAQIREEKKKILNKKELDEIDKKFSVNALKVLASRYLKKNENGEIVEGPKELFERVSILFAIPEILYDPRIFDKNGGFEPMLDGVKELKENFEEYDGLLKIGPYALNKYHFERFVSLYEELTKEGKMKVDIFKIIDMIKEGAFDHVSHIIKEYFDLMVSKDFLPNTPALVNAGRKLGLLSACFTLDVEDDMESIMKLARDSAIIHKAGGGTGANYSKLRPKGDIVGSTCGVASGPVSFMKIVDVTTDVVKQGGVRRGANMGILEIWHPDIEEFISAKQTEGVFENFNISVGVWDDFWEALKNNTPYPLINPRTGEIVKEVDPKTLLQMIAYAAWSKGDPGMLFFDNVNKRNVLIPAKNDVIRVTNPCGEEPLYPYESCNLASINVANFVTEIEGRKVFDFERFGYVIRKVVRALDNMISVNKYPLPEIDYNTKLTRRIGLGIMGLADCLFKLGIKYNSKEGFEMMERIVEHLTYNAYLESIELAKQRGPFPLFEKSLYVKGELPIEGPYQGGTLDWDGIREKIRRYGVRNAMVTTCAPTGSISMIADTSSGIEPVFALVFEKKVAVGSFYYIDPVFEQVLKERGLYSEELLKKIAQNYGSVQGIEEIPEDIREVFVTSMDIHWADHIMAQAILQRWVTDSISKTINMPFDATVDDVKGAYVLAKELGCKGITIYRDGSKSVQVINIEGKRSVRAKPSQYVMDVVKRLTEENPWLKEWIKIEPRKEEVVVAVGGEMGEVEEEKEEDGNKCPICGGTVVREEGCEHCLDCGWSACTVS